jgi:ABC-type transporter Mla MlaB component
MCRVSAATLTRPTVVDQLLAISVNVVVTLDGELDRSVEGVTSGIAFATHSADAIHVDVRHVSCIDAAGVRALLLSKQYAVEHGATLTVQFSGPGQVERLLQLVGLATWVD